MGINKEWCLTKDQHLDGGYHNKERKQRRVRCQKCKKRFMTIWKECQDAGCWHEYLPKHKKRKGKPIGGGRCLLDS